MTQQQAEELPVEDQVDDQAEEQREGEPTEGEQPEGEPFEPLPADDRAPDHQPADDQFAGEDQPAGEDRGDDAPAAGEAAPEFPALVVVGASAGGIDALTELLAPLDASFPAPIVVAQHTQPSRVSHLLEIFSGRTKLNVVSVTRKEQLKPGTVYLVPSDHHLEITDHVVEARKARGARPSPSIDRLLATAADVFGERLIAVILSGMGSDGVIGAGEVKARGGTVIIQNPETAAQPAMPRALPPTLVDFVANADRMAELLGELVVTPTVPVAENDARLLAHFLDRVRERTGIDFSAYKRPTIMRRLQRRMVATANPRLRDYVRYTQSHPEEIQRLSSAFLIKVTQFFRDTDLFDHLRSTLIPKLIEESRHRGRELRIWSAGCATGEEAYSLAILVAEALGPDLESFTVRIFATDVDDEAITFARRGVYPASAVGTVGRDLLEKYFVRDGDYYEVAKDIRAMVVFGQHDLGQRAPFPRIDLAMCRNVLIYFTADLQKRALQLFAFSLREGGYLALGKAESSTPYAEHFVLDQPRLKIYRRAGERVLIPPSRVRDTTPLTQMRLGARREPSWASGPQPGRDHREPARPIGDRLDALVLGLPVGIVLIDEHYDILFLNAMARRLLGIHGTAVGSDFIHLAHEIPSDELRAAVAAAHRGDGPVVTRPLRLQNDERPDPAYVQLTLQPFRPSTGAPLDAMVITVTDASGTVSEQLALEATLEQRRDESGQLNARLDRVTRSNRDLLEANEEMTNANVVLRTSNEELLVANEEVQAATEEVETLNEELQAANEELETLNEELQATVEELNTTNDDLAARTQELSETAASLAEQRQRSDQERSRLALILDGMTEAVMVVDHDGRTVATNRAYVAAFGTEDPLIPEDGSGRALPEIEWPHARAARGETFAMSFALVGTSGDRRWYEVSGRPGGDWGGVVVIRDITERSLRHLQERFIDTASHELQTPLAALHNYLQLVERGASRLDEPSKRYLAGAVEQSRYLGELAARLFDVSLIRHGRAVVEQDRVELRGLLTTAVEEVRLLHPDTELRLRSGSRRAEIVGDRLRLRQVLSNLLVNAVTHGASAEPVDVSLRVHDDAAVITVEDRGPGIPPALLPDLFTPFAAASQDGTSGLGLGLFLAHQITIEHAGTLSVEPRRGGGTIARLTFPMGDAPAPGAPRRSRSRTEVPQ